MSIAIRPTSIPIRFCLRFKQTFARTMGTTKEKPPPAVPRPSASVVIISPTNQVLLLQRVKTSSSFASALVFPGGNYSSTQDGYMPSKDDPAVHQDNDAYRLCALRETFEESGLVLAKKRGTDQPLVISEDKREVGRRLIHENKEKFVSWIDKSGGEPDLSGLIPFTRWITPPYLPKRFTTQMYLYFLPLSSESERTALLESKAIIPTPDGGVEHISAQFLPPGEWISKAFAGEMIIYPPQIYLLNLARQFLQPTKVQSEIEQQRAAFREFVANGGFGKMVICPYGLGQTKDGRQILALNKGGEAGQTGKEGDSDRAILVKFRKEGPQSVEIVQRKDVSKL